jgi:hypothetical protein
MKSKSDDHNQKATFVSQLGLETARLEIQRLFQEIKTLLIQSGKTKTGIDSLIQQVYQRNF